MASELEVARNGSLEMHAVNGFVPNKHPTGFVGSAARLEIASRVSRSNGSRRRVLLIARSKGQFVHRMNAPATSGLAGNSLETCSVDALDDAGLLAGSAPFTCNPAWGRHRRVNGVRCVLTRRTRLQYMRCNGVGGSTC
jgi:hypothetical protein